MYRTTRVVKYCLSDGACLASVPVGFKFSVSVPRWLQSAFNPHDVRFLAGAALHDHALEAGQGRVASARIFWGALEADGVSFVRRTAMASATIIWPLVRGFFPEAKT